MAKRSHVSTWKCVYFSINHELTVTFLCFCKAGFGSLPEQNLSNNVKQTKKQKQNATHIMSKFKEIHELMRKKQTDIY